MNRQAQPGATGGSDEALFSLVRLENGAATCPGEIYLAPDAMNEVVRRDGR